MAPSKKSQQIFLASYSQNFPGICASSKGKTYAYCRFCDTHISVATSGSRDVKRHCDGDKHVRLLKQVSAQKPITASLCKPAAEHTHQDAVMKAEVMLVELIAELNLPIAAADKFSGALKLMFPDSKIAQDFSCGRTKATAIAKDIAKMHQRDLITRMRNSPFTVSTDGSNDQKDKQFPIVVRTVDPNTKVVSSELLGLPVLQDSATGEAIFQLVNKIIEENCVPWSNCMALGCDNAAVMTGVNKGVIAFARQKNENIFLAGCTIHLAHIAAEKAAKTLPVSPADMLVDIFHFFKKSSLRQCTLSKFQELHSVEQKKMLKHVPTRWLSIGRCLDRLIENWQPLKEYFKAEYGEAKKGKSVYTCSWLCQTPV